MRAVVVCVQKMLELSCKWIITDGTVSEIQRAHVAEPDQQEGVRTGKAK
jgi:hypothetical protein